MNIREANDWLNEKIAQVFNVPLNILMGVVADNPDPADVHVYQHSIKNTHRRWHRQRNRPVRAARRARRRRARGW